MFGWRRDLPASLQTFACSTFSFLHLHSHFLRIIHFRTFLLISAPPAQVLVPVPKVGEERIRIRIQTQTQKAEEVIEQGPILNDQHYPVEVVVVVVTLVHVLALTFALVGVGAR